MLTPQTLLIYQYFILPCTRKKKKCPLVPFFFLVLPALLFPYMMIDVIHTLYNYSLMTFEMCVRIYNMITYYLGSFDVYTEVHEMKKKLEFSIWAIFCNEYLTDTYVRINARESVCVCVRKRRGTISVQCQQKVHRKKKDAKGIND